MNILIIRSTLLLAFGLLAAGNPFASAQHINAGALGTNQNDQLLFDNGANFVSTSGYTKVLTLTNAGTYAGYYQAGLTFVALSSTNTSQPLAPGSFIQLRLESVPSGPVGGIFSFWEDGATSPTFSLTVGAIGGTDIFPLSDVSLGAGAPGADPHGHLHGRRYTATEPGTYTVGFRLLDTSTNGTGGGPIHSAGELFLMNFTAVPEPSPALLLSLSALTVGGLIWSQKRKQK